VRREEGRWVKVVRQGREKAGRQAGGQKAGGRLQCGVGRHRLALGEQCMAVGGETSVQGRGRQEVSPERHLQQSPPSFAQKVRGSENPGAQGARSRKEGGQVS